MSISTYKVTKKSAHIQVFSLDMCRLNYELSLYRDFFSALTFHLRHFLKNLIIHYHIASTGAGAFLAYPNLKAIPITRLIFDEDIGTPCLAYFVGI